jgi:hypothetical protein
MHYELKALLLFAFASYTLLAFPSTSTTDNPQIIVYVYDDAQIQSDTLARAEQQATSVFSNAGLGVMWVNCVHPGIAACKSGGEPVNLILRITTKIARSTNDTAFGLAYLGPDGSGRYADVFWPRIEDLQVTSKLDAGLILGTVMAHELGHLLLGSNAHSVGGIMEARWQGWQLQRINMGTLLFLPSQAKRMRTKTIHSVSAIQGSREGFMSCRHGVLKGSSGK